MNGTVIPKQFMAAVILATAGCASARGAYECAEDRRVAAAGGVAGIRFDDADIERSFRLAEQLNPPLKLAVVGVERNEYGVFQDVESQELEHALAQERGVVRDVLPIFDGLAGPPGQCMELERLRRAAARAHADAILLYDQRVTIRDTFTPLRIFNLTLIGAWVFPTSAYEMTMDTRVAVIDVRNGVVFTTVRDVRTEDHLAPSATRDEHARDAKRDLRRKAFDAVRTALREKIENAQAQAPAPDSGLRYRTGGGGS